ncbi:hypothetical protein [Robiginitalea sp.]
MIEVMGIPDRACGPNRVTEFENTALSGEIRLQTIQAAIDKYST